MQPITIAVKIPEHTAGKVPEHIRIGKKLDALLKQNFMGKKVVIRCIGSQDHPDLILDELAEIVVETGTDKYDPKRVGVGYREFIEKHVQVDFYGETADITDHLDFMGQAIWEMHHSAIGDRAFGVHVDLVLIYDATLLDMVMNLYDYQPQSDGFVFKDPSNKRSALLGVIKITAT